MKNKDKIKLVDVNDKKTMLKIDKNLKLESSTVILYRKDEKGGMIIDMETSPLKPIL